MAIAFPRSEIARKAARYSAVSLFGVALTQTLLLVFNGVLDWPGTMANVAAVSLTSIPAYLLNRQWVWGRTGGHHLTREVLPFWGCAIAGLALSTVMVAIVLEWSTSAVALSGANIAAFGMLWVLKFKMLDQVLFAARVPVST